MGKASRRKARTKDYGVHGYQCGDGCSHHHDLPMRAPIGPFCHGAAALLRPGLPLTNEQREAVARKAFASAKILPEDCFKRVTLTRKALPIAARLPMGGDIYAKGHPSAPSDATILSAAFCAPLMGSDGKAQLDAAELLNLSRFVERVMDVREFMDRLEISVDAGQVIHGFDFRRRPITRQDTAEGRLFEMSLAAIARGEDYEKAKDLWWEDGLVLALNLWIGRPPGVGVYEYAFEVVQENIRNGAIGHVLGAALIAELQNRLGAAVRGG